MSDIKWTLIKYPGKTNRKINQIWTFDCLDNCLHFLKNIELNRFHTTALGTVLEVIHPHTEKSLLSSNSWQTFHTEQELNAFFDGEMKTLLNQWPKDLLNHKFININLINSDYYSLVPEVLNK